MKKIIIAVILILVVGAVFFYFFGSQDTGYIDGADALKKYDTSGEYCESDGDCSCASFTGAGFIDEELSGVCDTSTNSCVRCYYE